MNSKKCARCGTINEQEYIYCKNCGEPFTISENQKNNNRQYTPISYRNAGESDTDYSGTPAEIGGVDAEKLAAYVGVKKGKRIINMFYLAEATGKKVKGFNWAVFLTGTLLAFPFVSSWFFYRKMYKVGAIICAISIAFTLILTANGFLDSYTQLKNEYDKYESYTVEEILNTNTQDETNEINLYDVIPTKVETAVSFLQTVISVVLAIFAWNIYFKESTRRIKRLETINPLMDNNFYALAGLPSLASALLIPFCVRVLEMFISMAPAMWLVIQGADIAKVLALLLI